MAGTITKRRVEIAIEKRRLVFLKDRNAALDTWCEGCRALVRMVTPDQAAIIRSVSSRTIYRWLENGSVHFMETPAGFSLICLRSLQNRDDERNTKPVPKKNLMQRILKRR